MGKRAKRGSGSIFQRGDGRWVGQLTLGRDPVSGKLNRVTVYGCTLKEVQDKLQELRARPKDDQSEMQLKYFLDFWLCSVKHTLKDTSYESYESTIRNHIIPFVGLAKLSELTAMDVVKFYNQLEEAGRSSARKKWIAKVLRMALHAAVKLGMATRNVSIMVPMPKSRKYEANPLNESQVKYLLATIQNERLYPLFVLLLDSGIRIGEALALEWTDLEGDYIVIRKTLKRDGTIEVPKSEKSRRRVRLSPITVALLEQSKSTNPLMFPTKAGKRYTFQSIREIWYRIRTKVGFPTTRIHDLRHTHCCYLLLKGVNIKVISDRLGHSSIQVTLALYAHIMPGMEEQIVDLTTRLLTPGSSDQN